jgi:hypothetical protein
MPRIRFLLRLSGSILVTALPPVGVAASPSLTECIFQTYLPAVGEITYKGRLANNDPFEQTGTGFVVLANGTMLTAAHVVTSDQARPENKVAEETVEVKILGSSESASIESRDEQRDIAVLKLPRMYGRSWPTVPLRLDGDVAPGTSVWALGFPRGFDATVTPPAIVSSLNAKLNDKPKSLMQTSLDLEEGMSGGPVFDASGEVIGMSVQRHMTLTDVAYVLSTQKFGAALMGIPRSQAQAPCAAQPARLTEEKTWSSKDPKDLGLGVQEGQGFCFLTSIWGQFDTNHSLVAISIPKPGEEFVLGHVKGNASGPPGGESQIYGAAARCYVFPKP